MKGILFFLFALQASWGIAQDFTIGGRITDSNRNPISFANILLYKEDSETPLKGVSTADDGTFSIEKVPSGNYKYSISYLGFDTLNAPIVVAGNLDLGDLILKENTQALDETVVTAKLPTIKKTVGKLVFNVENTSLSVGNTMDLLKKTPGIVVVGEGIQIKFSSPTVYINGKRVYLSQSEIVSLLENTDAANIKSIEVITNPSAKFDADSGTVLNIVTSKAISIGYKGSVNSTFTQGVYPKYNFGTSHFYKNNWLNLYGSYNYNTKKEYKSDFNYIRFFEVDEVSTKSIWETDFNRTTNSENHNANVVMDFTLDEKNSLSFTSNISISPEVTFDNTGFASIYNPQRQLDSVFTTLSDVIFNKENLTFNLDYTRQLGNEGAQFTAAANYIYYNHNQNQNVITDYFLPDNTFLRNNSFYTESHQQSNIFTSQADISVPLWGGTLESGLKFSNIDTDSKLDFFDVDSNVTSFNNLLSDDFNYKENVYAEYINYEKEWEKWTVIAGLRGEYTDIDAFSRVLGEVNTQQYFWLFPSASIYHNFNENNGLGLSYNRSITRPRYQSLNPFRYFITENNFFGGNPNLQPAITDRITLSYDYKSKWFFSLYYENIDNALGLLTFQDNENSILRTVDANLIKEYQYSFDILFYDSLYKWWWFQIATSTYYLANEFSALESSQESYKNDTFGQYLQMASNFALSKDRSFTADLSGMYISNFVTGNRYFKNQSSINISFRKEFWDKRASLTVGVDDIFNTLDDVASVAQYYNQDNRFLVDAENRLFRIGFRYNFGNARLRDNNKQIQTDEGNRLQGN
ncbi:TonB-dependent receptor domain-containing protein [Aequorivita echinoideorum]|uniref:TonB-dependent receptor n=1 Tax=Aequorivita echinoideorum TaxID=1549647 RepID=A0ABS5S284_9FLAO|nr:TonB-dependent receptor [Aequorivita echinoideorum]MBT0607113.1 TonB-dependent receptor [Aequorivita echinoideorum]